MRFYFAFYICFVISSVSVADSTAGMSSVLQHGASRAELQSLQQQPDWNHQRFYSSARPDWQPVLDTSDFKYVLLSSEAGFSEAANLRYTIARNLPEGVKLVLLVTPGRLDQIKNTYSRYIDLSRVVFAVANNISNGFWARDAFPVPVKDPQGRLSLVSARYYRNFTAGSAVAGAVNASMSQNSFTFVGGNLLADEHGTCFVVASNRRFNSTDEDMKQAYGCKSLHVMPHVAGLGDIDEVIKPLGNGVMLTNEPAYVRDLESWGYRVVMMPKISGGYRTYINSLVVGKTVFMPAYGVASDEDARRVYESLGLQVVDITSNVLSDQMHGSVHCQTMAYPALNENELLRALNLTRAN